MKLLKLCRVPSAEVHNFDVVRMRIEQNTCLSSCMTCIYECTPICLRKNKFQPRQNVSVLNTQVNHLLENLRDS